MLTGYFNYASMDMVIEDLISVTLKTLLSIVVLFFLTKLMGNKQISQLSFFDYVVGITIGSIGADLATSSNPIHFSLIALILYAIVSVLISLFAIKSIKAKKFFTGKPIYLIKDGKILYENLSKAKVDITELIAEGRNQGQFDVTKITYAVMETNGRFSFFSDTAENFPINIILDGVIMENNLSLLKKDKTWLIKLLTDNGVNYKKLLLATKSKEQLIIQYKTGDKKTIPLD